MTAAVTTAVTPEPCPASASTYAAYGVTSAMTVPSTGSSVRRRISATPPATTTPASTPPPASRPNSPAVSAHDSALPATAAATATRNSNRLVASLNRLSACTRVCTRGCSASRRPSAVTATGSVLASTVPSRKARLGGSPVTATATAPTAAAEKTTKPTASRVTGRHTWRSTCQDRSSPAA
jgi:hypothetical protein